MKSNMGTENQEEIQNYYVILGCSVDSSLEEIRRSYHKMALKYHPDKNYVHQNSEIFQRIEEAWRILSDVDSRKEYDAQLKQTNLENISVLLYSRIKRDELEPDQDNPNLLKYTCRCGGDYKVCKSDIEESNCILQVPCQECTLVIEINT